MNTTQTHPAGWEKFAGPFFDREAALLTATLQSLVSSRQFAADQLQVLEAKSGKERVRYVLVPKRKKQTFLVQQRAAVRSDGHVKVIRAA